MLDRVGGGRMGLRFRSRGARRSGSCGTRVGTRRAFAESIAAAAVGAPSGLRLDEERYELGVTLPDPTFETDRAGFDLRRAQLFRALETGCDHDLVRCELNHCASVKLRRPDKASSRG